MTQEKTNKVAKTAYFKKTFSSPWPWILTTLALIVFYTLGDIIKLILPLTKYNYIPGFVSEIAANKIRLKLAYPLSELLNWSGGMRFLIIPYYLLLSYIIYHIHLRIKRYYLKTAGVLLTILLIIRLVPDVLIVFESSKPSISMGKTTNGTIEYAKRIPYQGENYISYSFLGYLWGRTYVTDAVKNTIEESFESIGPKVDGRVFVVGEASLKHGGPTAFHKGKQNGLEVDFLLPFNTAKGEKYTSQNIFNTWNYGLKIEAGKFEDDLEVDYNALATHIAALYRIAPKYGLSIKKIEMHPDIFNGLYGNSVGGIMKGIFRLAGKKESKKAAAYYTIIFEPNNGKKNIIDKIIN